MDPIPDQKAQRTGEEKKRPAVKKKFGFFTWNPGKSKKKPPEKVGAVLAGQGTQQRDDVQVDLRPKQGLDSPPRGAL